MKDLSRDVNMAFSQIMDGFKEKDVYHRTNILPEITTDSQLRSRLVKILNEDKNLEIIHDLIKLNSIDKILEYHKKIDPKVGAHCENVGLYGQKMVKFAKDLDAKTMLYGGYSHDLGKILIPKSVLHGGYIDELENPSDKHLVTRGHVLLNELLTLLIPALKEESAIIDMMIYHHDGPKEGSYPHLIVPRMVNEVEALKVTNEFDNPDYISAIKIADTVHAMEREEYQIKFPKEFIYSYLVAESNKGHLSKRYVNAFLRSEGLGKKEIMKLRGK